MAAYWLGEVLQLAIRWAHAVAALAWVGGSLFYLLALRPAIVAGGTDAKFQQAVAARFREVVDASIIVLAVSGLVLTFVRLSSGAAGPWYVALLGLKIALALAMCALAWELGRNGRRRRQAAAARTWLGAWLEPSRLVLVLGLSVTLLAVVLRYLFEAGLRGLG